MKAKLKKAGRKILDFLTEHKKIFLNALIVLLVLGCLRYGLELWVTIGVRPYNREEEIDNEMVRRIDLIYAKQSAISMAEFTPFIWDEAYYAWGYLDQEEFNAFLGDLKEQVIFYGGASEYSQQMKFFYNDQFIFNGLPRNLIIDGIDEQYRKYDEANSWFIAKFNENTIVLEDTSTEY